jgi:pSer/pThr/pTyr-binding forkhead associated (FHA) protein
MILEVLRSDTGCSEKVKIAASVCVVGRSSRADYRIDLPGVSRKHFQVELIDGEFFVTDLHSANGVYLNGERIPPGEKILLKSFLPIEIGGEASVFVHPDRELTRSDFKFLNFTSLELPPMRSEGESRTQIKPKSKDRLSPLSNPVARSKVKSHQLPVKSQLIGGFILVALGVIFFYQYETKKVQNTSASETKSLEGSLPLKVSEDELKSLLKKNDCSDLKKTCSSVGLVYANEKIVISGKKMVIYVDYNEHLKKINSQFLAKALAHEQAEYILGEVAFNPLLVILARERALEHIVVVGISTLEELILIKFSTLVSVAKVPSLTGEVHRALFSNLYFAGHFRPFQLHLKPASEFIVF